MKSTNRVRTLTLASMLAALIFVATSFFKLPVSLTQGYIHLGEGVIPLGAALLAGLAVGVWKDMDEISRIWKMDLSLTPLMDEPKRAKLLRGWHKAVSRSMNWIMEENDPL